MGEETDADTRLRLDLAYDGTDFAGWAKQPGLRTVQGELERALATVFHGHQPRVTTAGRTDAGVHASGQVAHVDVPTQLLDRLGRRRSRGHERPLDAVETLRRRINGIAGQAGDLVVSRVMSAPPGFDARFGALWRRYEYRLADDASARDPLQRRRTAWVSGVHEVEAMDAAAATLLGLRDFAAFCRPREGATTIRTLQSFSWRRDDAGVLVAEVQADAFCHSMVRALVGACAAVGDGRMSLTDLVEARDAAQRTNRFAVMPARGLTLAEVGYPDDVELLARAEQTRGLRVLPEFPG